LYQLLLSGRKGSKAAKGSDKRLNLGGVVSVRGKKSAQHIVGVVPKCGKNKGVSSYIMLSRAEEDARITPTKKKQKTKKPHSMEEQEGGGKQILSGVSAAVDRGRSVWQSLRNLTKARTLTKQCRKMEGFQQ